MDIRCRALPIGTRVSATRVDGICCAETVAYPERLFVHCDL